MNPYFIPGPTTVKNQRCSYLIPQHGHLIVIVISLPILTFNMLNALNVENGSIVTVCNQTSLMVFFYVLNALEPITPNL